MLKRLLHRKGMFHGGLYLPARRELTAQQSIEPFPPPRRLSVPMLQHDGPAARVAVQVGQEVRAGELIGRADDDGAVAVHAPASGTVTALARVDTAWAHETEAVQIELHEPGKVPDPGDTSRSPSPPEPCSVKTLVERAHGAGIVNSGPPAVGLGWLLREAANRSVDTVIINAMESEPMLTAENRLLAESSAAILATGQWLHTALGTRRIWLAVDRANRPDWSRYDQQAAGTPIRVIGLANKYPQGSPVLLTRAITSRQTPYGQSPLDVGVLVLEVSAVAALARPEPMVDRVVTVTGQAARRPGNYRMAAGTRFADVLRHVGLTRPVAAVIEGGPMTGRAVESLEMVVTKRTTAILLAERDAMRTPRPGPCVRCGWCQEDCPAGLDPVRILDLFERNETAPAAALYPHACLDCGLCSYVCPAELPLAEAVSKMKQLVPLNALLRAQRSGSTAVTAER